MAIGIPFGEYRLIRRLGAGGMAEVFLACRDGPAGFRKDLVIKRILPHLARSPSFVEMFLKEARVAALIDHPNLVHVSAFGEIDGEYYLAMEFVDGFSLAEVVRRVGTMSPGVACRIAIDLLEALHAVHGARGPQGERLNLVHRDVSPGNVMLTREGAVKLLDFGIAVSADDETTSRMGTRRFMSPEALAGGSLDRRSDLFAVGVLVYALICGRFPFDNLPTEAPNPADEIPEPLWSTIKAALALDPDDRPASARAMQSAMELFLTRRGMEGTRTHLAQLLQSVLPPAHSAAERVVSRLTQQLTHLTRAVTGTAASGPTTGTASARNLLLVAALIVGLGGIGMGGWWWSRRQVNVEALAPAKVARGALPTQAAAADPTHPGSPNAAAVPTSAAAAAARAVAGPTTAAADGAGPTHAAAGAADPTTAAAGAAGLTPAAANAAAPTDAKANFAASNPADPTNTAANPTGSHAAAKSAASNAAGPTNATGPTNAASNAAGPTNAAAAPPPRRRRKPAAAKYGRLTIDTRPWTEVFFQGRRLGMTPLQGVRLPAGRHRLRLENRASGLETTVTVRIRPGRETRIRKTL